MRLLTLAVLTAALAVPAHAAEPSGEAPAAGPCEIQGLDAFHGSEAARRLLLKNGFVVTDETCRQICSFYWLRGTPFITTDTLLYGYYLNVEKALGVLERKRADELPAILEGAERGLAEVRAKEIEPLVKEKGLDRAWEKAAADAADFLRVARLLAEGKTSGADMAEAPEKVRAEVALVLAAGRQQTSPLRGFPLDYSRFRPRGFYAGAQVLRSYYRAVTWLYEVPFCVEREDESRQAVVLARVLKGQPKFRDAAVAYQAFLGPSDEIGMADWSSPLPESAPLERLASDKKLWAAGWSEMQKLPAPRQSTILTAEAIGDPGLYRGPRVLARPLLFDNDVLRILTPFGLVRPPPSGEELMALMGSAAAREIVMAREGKQVAGYAPLFEKALAEVPPAEKRGDTPLCRTQRDLFRTLLGDPADASLPAYYRSAAWRYKDLNTCLSGWAHYRYIWDLHGKRESHYMCDADVNPGAIEPNPAFFEKLQELAALTDDFFASQGVKHAPFADLKALLADVCAVLKDQMANRPVGKTGARLFEGFGESLAHVCGFLGNAYVNDEALPDTPFSVPVATSVGPQVERVVGQGRPRAIYVIDERAGKRWLLVGGVLSYRDGVRPWPGSPDAAARESTGRPESLEAPAWEDRFAGGFTRDELLATLRAGRVTEVMFDHADRAMGDVLAELLAREDWPAAGTDEDGRRTRARARGLLGRTGHPKVFEILLPRLEKPMLVDQPNSWYQWPDARAVRGNLTEEHAALIKKWIDEGHPYRRPLLGLLATIPGEKVETMLLEHLDREAERLRALGGATGHGGGDLPRYFYDTDYETVLHGLLDRPGLSASRRLAERLETYTGEPLRWLTDALAAKWLGAPRGASNGEPAEVRFTLEEESFAGELRPKLDAAGKKPMRTRRPRGEAP